MYYAVNNYNTRQNIPKKNTGKNILRVLIILISLSLILAISVFHSAGKTQEEYVNVKIKSGQTIWEIASKNSSDDTNLRKLVYDIKKINRLKTAELHPGDRIKVPINR